MDANNSGCRPIYNDENIDPGGVPAKSYDRVEEVKVRQKFEAFINPNQFSGYLEVPASETASMKITGNWSG